MTGEPQYALVLYIPDVILGAMNARKTAQGRSLWPEQLGFVLPGWWEEAYTARLSALPELGAQDGEAPSDADRSAEDFL